MSTLLVRLAAPLQSWGIDSRFETRRTERIPSKSGVIGLVAAALGYSRDADLSELCGLRFGVRVDRDGELLRDYHIARKLIIKNVKDKKDKDSNADNEKDSGADNEVRIEYDTYVTHRYYLSDAIFLAGLESDDTELLERIDDALHNPVYPLFLGRRSCPPTLPLTLGLRDDDLYTSLANEPWQVSEYMRGYLKRREHIETPSLRIVVDDADGGAVIRDLPLSFDVRARRYGFRRASDKGYVTLLDSFDSNDALDEVTDHDAFAELEG